MIQPPPIKATNDITKKVGERVAWEKPKREEVVRGEKQN